MTGPLKVLFVWPAAEFSTWDVARGLRDAMGRMDGLELRDYRLYNRLAYHATAFASVSGADPKTVDTSALAKAASETVLVEALYQGANVVVIVSAPSFHPNALWLLSQVQMPVVIVHTESPYEDAPQRVFSEMSSLTFTNDRWSALREGWEWLPHAYDPAVHRPAPPTPGEPASDVLILGTGWPERQRFLEQIDWAGLGIKLRILGLWPGINSDSPLFPFYEQRLVDNEDTPGLYATARICLNFHRSHPKALSLNPRARELAACGAFQISDYRAELADVFGGAVPVFDATEPKSLEVLVRHYLHNDAAREELRLKQMRAVADVSHTFDARAHTLIETMADRLTPKAATPAS